MSERTDCVELSWLDHYRASAPGDLQRPEGKEEYGG